LIFVTFKGDMLPINLDEICVKHDDTKDISYIVGWLEKFYNKANVSRVGDLYKYQTFILSK
jgi:hypothetical protein